MTTQGNDQESKIKGDNQKKIMTYMDYSTMPNIQVHLILLLYFFIRSEIFGSHYCTMVSKEMGDGNVRSEHGRWENKLFLKEGMKTIEHNWT